MNKIIVAFDNMHYSRGAMDYVRLLHRVGPVHVTGVFLPGMERVEPWNHLEGGPTFPILPGEPTETEEMILRKNIASFSHVLGETIPYRVHRDFHRAPLGELVRETRFADLMVIGSEVFFEDEDDPGMSARLREVLTASECPVVLVPEKFEFPGSNIIAYDGSASSVHAIKQFIYLFPEWCKNPTLLVHASEKGSGMPEETFIRELTEGHFHEITFSTLAMHPMAFTSWLSEKKGALLICGSFGRSAISAWIRRSFVSETVERRLLPVFTAHK